MAIHKKDGNAFAKTLDKLMSRSWDIDRVKRIPNKIFPLVNIVTVGHFYVSQILISGGNSYDILYLELFEKMGFKKENLWTNERSDLQTFKAQPPARGDTLEKLYLWGKEETSRQ